MTSACLAHRAVVEMPVFTPITSNESMWKRLDVWVGTQWGGIFSLHLPKTDTGLVDVAQKNMNITCFLVSYQLLKGSLTYYCAMLMLKKCQKLRRCGYIRCGYISYYITNRAEEEHNLFLSCDTRAGLQVTVSTASIKQNDAGADYAGTVKSSPPGS